MLQFQVNPKDLFCDLGRRIDSSFGRILDEREPTLEGEEEEKFTTISQHADQFSDTSHSVIYLNFVPSLPIFVPPVPPTPDKCLLA